MISLFGLNSIVSFPSGFSSYQALRKAYHPLNMAKVLKVQVENSKFYFITDGFIEVFKILFL